MFRKLLLLAVVVLFCSDSFSQIRKYSNEFLNIGVGSNNLGMSNANVATVSDVTAGYWNPSGLLNMSSHVQVTAMHSEYFAGIAKYDYGSFAALLDSSSAIGFSVVRFGVDNIPNTTELIDANGNINYDRITSFSAADYGFLFSYARKSNIPGLQVGANVKIIHRLVGSFAKAWGFGLDAGAQYKREDWQFGVMARDVTSTFNAWSFDLSDRMKEVFVLTGNDIPNNSVEITLPKLILGVARKVQINDDIYLLPEFDLDFTFDGKRNVLIGSSFTSIDPHLGAEFGFWGIGFIRAGIGNFQRYTDVYGNKISSIQPNLGMGVKLKRLSIDYALTNVGAQSGLYSNVFSFRYDIKKQKR